jgi:hypothetical protein
MKLLDLKSRNNPEIISSPVTGPVTGLEIISGELEAFLGRLDTTFQELVNFVAGVVLTFGRTTALVCK